MRQPELMPEIERSAVFSPCRTWRYTLERYWDKSKPFVLFILLNPSTADEMQDDPTNRRGISFAKDWGYGGVIFCNLFAFRTAYPAELRKAVDDKNVMLNNYRHVLYMAKKAGIVICAWGINGKHLDRGKYMLDLLSDRDIETYHMGLTKDGYPKHILYLKADTKPQLWER